MNFHSDYNKYHAIKTKLDGITFDSRKEAERYAELKLLERANKIAFLELQKRFCLIPSFEHDGIKERATYYIADFYYYDIEKGCYVAEDTKGMRTEVYKLKRKMFLLTYPKIKFIEL